MTFGLSKKAQKYCTSIFPRALEGRCGATTAQGLAVPNVLSGVPKRKQPKQAVGMNKRRSRTIVLNEKPARQPGMTVLNALSGIFRRKQPKQAAAIETKVSQG
jgi:hypothetical protein